MLSTSKVPLLNFRNFQLRLTFSFNQGDYIISKEGVTRKRKKKQGQLISKSNQVKIKCLFAMDKAKGKKGRQLKLGKDN